MSKPNSKGKLAIVLVAVIIVAVIGGFYYLTLPQAPSEPLKLGIMIPLSGASARDGQLMKNAFTLAADEINAQGGIRGRKIELIIEDIGATSDLAVSAAKKLVSQDKVYALLGNFLSGQALATVPQSVENKIITIYTVASSPQLMERVATDPAQKYLFRIATNDTYLGTKIGLFLKDVAKVKSFYWVSDDLLYARDVYNTLAKDVESAGIKAVGADFPKLGTTDYSSETRKIRTASPDIVVFMILGNGGISFYKQLKSDPVTAKLAVYSGHNPFASEANVKAVEQSLPGSTKYLVVGTIGSTYVETTSKTKPFVDKYTAKFGVSPEGNYDDKSYDAVYVLSESIKKAGTFETDKVVEAMEKIDYSGVSGRIVFSKAHQALLGGKYIPQPMVQWIDGKPNIVWPLETAKVGYVKPPA